MNYHTSEELKDKTLQLGDLVNFCGVGHAVTINSFKNLGDCKGSWVFSTLDLSPKEFCQAASGKKVDYNERDYWARREFPTFEEGDFHSLTLVAIAIMKEAESQGNR